MAITSPVISRAELRPRRVLRRWSAGVLAVLLLLAGAASWVYWRVRASLPQFDGVVRIRGLRGKVQVFRDRHGIPHIRAASLEDLVLAQGYVTAQDRLWQMDLSRRMAKGRLSELFAERTLRLDIANRTLGLGRVAERAVRDFDPATRRLFSAYAQGVNAFISTHQDRLPIEFLLLRYHPEPWREADSLDVALNMAKELNTSWFDDLMREHVHLKLGNAKLSTDVFPDRSPLDRPVAQPLSKPAAAARVPASETRLHLFGTESATLPVDKTAHLGSLPAALVSPGSYSGLGSNNWVVSGVHTRSGKPLLANDPHLAYRVPSVWYMINLKAPGINVTGVSLPGLPLVIIGHNESIAWGMTNTDPDVQDLYEEHFNPHNPREYLHDGQWIEDNERTERIRVRGKPDDLLRVKVTRHGPIVSHDGKRELALAWTALLPHGLPYPFQKIDEARNWKEFTDALRGFAGPMQNFVYADTAGNIGFYAAGRVPIRKHGDGSVPVPGSTDRYDWAGMIPFRDLPHAYNPPNGILATANGRIVPDGYPYFITTMWAAPYRTERINQLLDSGKSFTVEDMLKIQADIHPLDDEWLRNRLLAAATEYSPTGRNIRYVLDALEAWDGAARVNSVATLVCEVTRRTLLHRVLEPRLGANSTGYHWPMSTVFLQNVIDHNLLRWLPPGDRDFNQTLVRSLEEAVKRIPQVVGSTDPGAWEWGNTIPLIFRHPLGHGSWLLAWLFNVGPFPQSGTETTIHRSSPTVGVSMRMVVDLYDLDQSVQNITLGESGQVSSAYYKDQFNAWYHNRSFPMLFSNQAVERGAIHRLVLEPAAPAKGMSAKLHPKGQLER